MNEPTAGPARFPCPMCAAPNPLSHYYCGGCGNPLDPEFQTRRYLLAVKANGGTLTPAGAAMAKGKR